MKTWEVGFEVFFDASDIRSVRVRANTKRKAISLAREIIRQETGWELLVPMYVKEVEE